MTGQELQVLLFLCLLGSSLCLPQLDLDYLVENLKVKYTVVENTKNVHYRFQLDLMNDGSRYVAGKDWAIYFCHIRMIEPDSMMIEDGSAVNPDGIIVGEPSLGLRLYHINGCLFKIVPTENFWGWSPQVHHTLNLEGGNWQVARTDVMPNWYLSGDEGTKARTILSTAGESLDFVTDFTSPEQWKRTADDKYDPYTPEERYDMYSQVDASIRKRTTTRIIPQPQWVNLSNSEVVHISPDVWTLVGDGDQVLKEALQMTGKLGLHLVSTETYSTKKKIHLSIKQDLRLRALNRECSTESYTISISTDSMAIVGGSSAGLFYGIKSFLSLTSENLEVPVGTLDDTPRFPYRGMHADVGRNYQGKDAILKLLDAMAHYKLNKFHFHLTDDEAWRLDIPGIPELVQIGSQQCHDPSGDECIMPQLGGDTEKGQTDHKYYSVSEYKEILKYANDLHIEVIPEFDLPGHCHSAINAMLARYRKYKDSDEAKATEYLLTDLEDPSKYFSVQMFTDNAVNPCVNSSYAFVQQVLDQIISMHKDIQPLKIFNFGGDEVPPTAWLKSPACQRLGLTKRIDIKTYFIQRIAEMADDKGLDLAAWEDGVMSDGAANLPYDKSEFATDTIYAYAWSNIWEWGSGARAYKLANAKYKTVISHATHFYYDHPSEPDPEERGYYWATRLVSPEKSFGYMPDAVYENINIDLFGNQISKEGICERFECPELQDSSYIAGIQGQLWSETVRTEAQFDAMIFPRMLSMAERAWHKAFWESEPDKNKRDAERREDWLQFAKAVGEKELNYLDGLGIKYHVRPPGAKILGSILYVNTEYHGQPVRYSTDEGQNWYDVTGGKVELDPGVTKAQVVTLSNNRKVKSRIAKVEVQ